MPQSSPDVQAALDKLKRRTQMMNVAFGAANRMVEQDDQWGPSDHPDGINEAGDMDAALDARNATDTQKALLGGPTWRVLLDEEVAKLYAARTPQEAADRLLDVMAVAGSWAMRLQDRAAGTPR
jgi:hypothetical protein